MSEANGVERRVSRLWIHGEKVTEASLCEQMLGKTNGLYVAYVLAKVWNTNVASFFVERNRTRIDQARF